MSPHITKRRRSVTFWNGNWIISLTKTFFLNLLTATKTEAENFHMQKKRNWKYQKLLKTPHYIITHWNWLNRERKLAINEVHINSEK